MSQNQDLQDQGICVFLIATGISSFKKKKKKACNNLHLHQQSMRIFFSQIATGVDVTLKVLTYC